MPSAPLAETPWYVHAFDRTWLRIYSHRSDAEAEARCDDIVRLLGARAGERVLDVGCGSGRYSRALRARGLRVTGVDLSEELLAIGVERGMALPNATMFTRRDMRNLCFAMQFEHAVSLFTSFGYFEDPSDDLAVFRGVRRALVPGGHFLIDYLNADRVRSSLVAQDSIQDGTLRIDISRRIEADAHGDRILKSVVARDHATGVELKRFEERVRLYACRDIDALLEQAGLEPIGEALGDTDGTPLGPAAPRLVRVARRR